MKLTYCIHSIYNPGGMERVLLNKVTHRSIRFPKAWKSQTWESIIPMTTIKARF